MFDNFESFSFRAILFVADDEKVLRFAQRSLAGLNLDILVAKDAHEALHIARICPCQIQLLITHIALPDMAGAKLANHMLNLFPGIATLYISNGLFDLLDLPDSDDVVSSVLSWPVSRAIFVNRVKGVLQSVMQRKHFALAH